MAVADYTNLTAITRNKILPGIEDNISQDNALFRRLWGKAQRQDGGLQIHKVVKYHHSTQGGFYSGLDTLDAAQEDTRTRAKFEWRQIHQPIVLSNIDVAKNGGTSKVFDLVKTDAMEAQVDLKDKLGTALYTAQSGDTMESLVDACDDGTNVATYGDITRSSNDWWKGSYNGTGGALSLSMIATRYDDCRSGSEVPTLMVTHKSEWTSYEALLQPQARYTGTNNIDGGFQTLYFRGTPLIDDEYCSDGYMYFLNEKFLQVIYMKHPDFPTDSKGFAVTDLRVPTRQDGKIGYILSYVNLICTKPKRQGVIRSIT